jgi:hypothetical protein
MLKHTPYAGTPRTMKESYQGAQHDRRKWPQEQAAKAAKYGRRLP